MSITPKIYFIFLLLSLWGLSSAWAQTVKLIGENFDKGEVTFSVNLSPATPTWVFVDYTHPPTHDPAFMSRATFTSVTFTPSGAGTLLPAEKRGFRLTSSATVTATLNGAPPQFSWCAYAIGVPPNAKLAPNGSYTLLGTPPFTINENITVDSFDFGPGTCITSITDFTYNPDGFFPDPPEVTATVSGTTVCAGSALTFTATATGSTTTAMSYTWKFAGATTTATTTTATNPYIIALADADTYTCSVFVTNANGCTSTVSATDAVTVYAIPAVHAGSSETVCAGATATFSASVDAGATIDWYDTDGTKVGEGPSYIPASPLTVATSYYAEARNTTTQCVSPTRLEVVVTVNPLPEPKFENAPTAACPNSEVWFTASGAGAGGSYCFTYECTECVRNPFQTGEDDPAVVDCKWNTECVFGTADTYSVIMPDSGSMTVWVQAMNQYGCTSTASTTVAIRDAFDTGSISSTGQTICSGDAVTPIAGITPASSENGITYEWRHDGGNISGDTNAPDYTPSAYNTTVGTHTFTRWASDGECLSRSAGSYVLTVNERPEPFNAGSVTICAGNTATFSAEVAAGAIINWYDAPTDGNMISPNTWSYAPDSPLTATTSYYAEASNTVTGCVSSVRLPVTTTVNPLPVITVDGVPDAPLCSGSEITLIVSGAGAGGSYCIGDECVFNTAMTFNIAVPDTPGELNIRVRAKTALGCEDGITISREIVNYQPGAIVVATATTQEETAPLFNPTNETAAGGSSVTYQWRRSGTTSATLANSNTHDYALNQDCKNYNDPGTYYFTRWEHDETCLSFAQSQGTFTLIVEPIPLPAFAVGTNTWYCANREWSGALRNAEAGCDIVDYGTNRGYGYLRDCAQANRAVLCPEPWRVPNTWEGLETCYPRRYDLAQVWDCTEKGGGSCGDKFVQYPNSPSLDSYVDGYRILGEWYADGDTVLLVRCVRDNTCP